MQKCQSVLALSDVVEAVTDVVLIDGVVPFFTAAAVVLMASDNGVWDFWKICCHFCRSAAVPNNLVVPGVVAAVTDVVLIAAAVVAFTVVAELCLL